MIWRRPFLYPHRHAPATIAQLAVGVSGFSGIAIAFNRQPGRLSEVEAYRVLILFSNSLAAAFLSLLPFAFFHLGWAELTVLAGWRCALRPFRDRLSRPAYRPDAAPVAGMPGTLQPAAALAHHARAHPQRWPATRRRALGLVQERALACVLLGLLWLLFASLFQFGRILFVPAAERRRRLKNFARPRLTAGQQPLRLV